MGDLPAVLKAAAALAVLGAAMWGTLAQVPTCPFPDAEAPGRIAALGADHVLRIFQRQEGRHVQVGERAGVERVAAAWYGWAVAEAGRVVRIDDAGFELAAAPLAPGLAAEALAFDAGHVWVATAAELTAYDEQMQPAGRLALPEGPRDLAFRNGTVLLPGVQVDARDPRDLHLVHVHRTGGHAPVRQWIDGAGGRWLLETERGIEAVGLDDGAPLGLVEAGDVRHAAATATLPAWTLVEEGDGPRPARIDARGAAFEVLCEAPRTFAGTQALHAVPPAASGPEGMGGAVGAASPVGAVLGGRGTEVALLHRDGPRTLLELPVPVATLAAQ